MVRVVLAEDSPTARDLLIAILNSDPAIDVIGVAKDGEEAVELARTLRPDVILMDLQMPRKDGITATREIIAECPVPIVIASASVDVRPDEMAARLVAAVRASGSRVPPAT